MSDPPLRPTQADTSVSQEVEPPESTIEVARGGATDTRGERGLPEESAAESETAHHRSQYGRYEVQRVLGQGGFGQVLLAYDPQLQRQVALKVPRRKWPSSQQQIDAFLSEARAAARLKHPGLVAVYDTQLDGQTIYIVQEYVDGIVLNDWARDHRPLIEEAIRLLIEVTEAVGYAHRHGFVHRDLKPANILVDAQRHAHVTDFGLALHESEQASHQGEISGTVAYMSPEQVRGESHYVDGRSDLWSLGVILYELLTGRLPFSAEPVQKLCEEILEREPKPPRMTNEAVPQELERIVLKCLAKRAGDRYATAKDLAHDLRRCLEPARRGRRRVVAGLGLAALTAVGAWLGFHVTHGGVRGPSSSQPDAASIPPSKTLRIESVEIQQLVRNTQGRHVRQGVVLQDRYQLREGDAVQFRARLSRPAYCYWIAFRPDGVQELCFPEDSNKPPPLTDEPKYPAEDPDHVVYGLTDGVGIQAFAIVVSDEPLPPYRAWCARRGTSPWQATRGAPLSSIVVHAADWVEEFPLDDTHQTRGAGMRVQGASSGLDDLVAWLRADSQSVALEVWALPVLPGKRANNDGSDR